jgi:hypothetical protein
MVRISVSDAVRCGFGLLRREWRAVLVWSGLYLVASLAAYGVLIGEWATFSNPEIDGAELGRLESKALGWNLLSIALSQAATVLTLCAVIRAVLHPEDRGFFYLKLSAGELWVAIASLAGAVLVLAPLLPALVLGSAAYGGMPEGSDLTPLMLAAFAAGLAGIVAAIWIGVRLTPLLPLAFEQKRVPVKEAWRLTRGHVWRIALLILTLMAVTIGVSIVFFVLIAVIGLAVGVSTAALTGGAFGSEVLPAITTMGISMTVLGAGYTGALYTVINGAWVDLYRQLTATPDEAPAEASA